MGMYPWAYKIVVTRKRFLQAAKPKSNLNLTFQHAPAMILNLKQRDVQNDY